MKRVYQLQVPPCFPSRYVTLRLKAYRKPLTKMYQQWFEERQLVV